jgi:hypothetical protein
MRVKVMPDINELAERIDGEGYGAVIFLLAGRGSDFSPDLVCILVLA